ncbi:metal ABC transporter solute-binding protein, Zn/Mn family [bacterium endosymbiont of Bathymodiolus sp. 5 South]|jgi:zinc transport system substrate-binding protein|uniref:metal ABC transporter solute-binding protein, Zn/Mn family n=1 Tax=bacterium endosymbiont of Bathymodiolus sp. 5 South TaxID=1181670 RepID=UPI0010B2ADA7|nr:zinc ABC transporter substrate-binding protein [bacterium endosymbiont of Bathymodiolus sp. 5 South]CAC9640946.1 Zinc ABC transporter, substrate-binding protein ZnuA [uncultured Gammaproteobacteria bacterium]SHN90624.1 Zinc ABC transporter, substrate-binding protein ZnuA [bacterium endosymbiont of Bathymodiolus sp. 5 South]SSC08356.1 Zinc ABC transporter, periplasmic-binding protein ZnuA [bacterium endosymbiont of Bathymodiolus sp. 5 South]VVH55282.1 Zinc ABC transporter, periplasmic-binding
MLRIVLIFFFVSANVVATPNIVVSIKPIHSIVSNITQGITTPKLLIKDNQSPHNFHLKPSQMSLVSQADLLISVHPSIEEGIAKALDNIDTQRKLYVVEKSTQPLNEKHKEHKEHKEHRHHEEHKAHEEHRYHGAHKDYHIWLNIDAIQKFSTRLTNKLIAIDTDNRLIYRSNLSVFNKKLDTLKTQIKKQLLPYQNTPMVTYSNAFKNFIQTNQLNTLAIVVNNHEQKPSVKNILTARKIIRSKNAQCLVSTIEITPKRVSNIIENFNMKHESIDIIGFKQTQGASQYLALMQNIANAFEKCLK